MASVRPTDQIEALILMRHHASEIIAAISKRNQPACQCIPEVQRAALSILHLIDGLRIEEPR